MLIGMRWLLVVKRRGRSPLALVHSVSKDNVVQRGSLPQRGACLVEHTLDGLGPLVGHERQGSRIVFTDVSSTFRSTEAASLYSPPGG